MSQTRKRRVAAYARVSTDKDEQITSYKAQVDYYKKMIQSNEDWEYVDVYADEGITGTSTKSRKRFNETAAPSRWSICCRAARSPTRYSPR